MPVDLQITVTKDTLRQTMYCAGPKSKNCAIAHAVRDIFPTASVAKSIWIIDAESARSYEIPLPKKARYFITVFDSSSPKQRLQLPEFSFTITISDEVIDTINIEALRPALEGHPNLQIL